MGRRINSDFGDCRTAFLYFPAQLSSTLCSIIMAMQNEGGAHFELPDVKPEQAEQSAEQAQDKAVEKQRPASQEASVGKHAPQPGDVSVPDLSDLSQPTLNFPSEPADTPMEPPDSPATTNLRATDSDLIEKEWVAKIKSTTAQTKDDPHRQKAEISKIKADYIYKRFKKIIKTDGAAKT